jgi:ribosomal protein S18 acetylase RimI-like enzyme
MNSSELEFREAHSTDYANICSLVTSREEQFLIFPRGRWPFTVRQLHKLAEERIAMTVVCVNETIVGFANLYNHVSGSSAYIGNVIVAQSWRGRDIGRALVVYMMNLATSVYRLPEIRISVFEHNVAAVTLYRSIGFRVYEREQKQDPEGEAVTLLHMRCRLNE